jgi:glycine dehydrogenase
LKHTSSTKVPAAKGLKKKAPLRAKKTQKRKFSKTATDDHTVHHKYVHDGTTSKTRIFEDYPVGTGSPHELRHVGPNQADVAEMCKVMGVSSIDELVGQAIPEDLQIIQKLAAGHGATEHEALAAMKKIMSKNKIFKSYIGKGYYGTRVPNVILRSLIENPAWYTPYTPYQAEIAQGRLEMLLNYQTVCADLTGLPVASASLLDEATAGAEALMMLWGRSKQSTVLVDKNTHVQTIDVIMTRAKGFGWNVKLVDPEKMEESVCDDTFAVLMSYPGSDGNVDGIPQICKNVKTKHTKCKIAVATDLMALSVLEPPSEFGADVCFGSSQRFGVPMGYGGPHAAFLTTTTDYQRKIPGRIIGISKDVTGKPALRMAMQSREQHIRRERASSNICTAQALLANVAAAYAVHHGSTGIKHIADTIHATAVTVVKKLKHFEQDGVHVKSKHFFDTVAVEFKNKEQLHHVLEALEEAEINVHVEGDHTAHISFDEVNATADSSNTLLTAIHKGVKSQRKLSDITVDHIDVAESLIPSDLKRTKAFLTHPVFNSHRSETSMLRYLYSLQQKDLSLTTAMIPLGSCTMKLNATTEMIPLTWSEVGEIHPFANPKQTKGYAELLDTFSEWFCNITGFDSVSLQPNSGAQGEYAGLQTIISYHKSRGQGHRNICLIPASAHGTNPASAAMAGLAVVVVNCDENGNVDVEDLKMKAKKHEDNLAAIQITYPSTHGVYETAIKEMCQIVHQHGGQVYLDGANLNAQAGHMSPGDLGADVCHLNLHKTLCIPHGGGGPGMGPIGVAAHLAEFLPRHSYHTKKNKTYEVSNITVPSHVRPQHSPFSTAPHMDEVHHTFGTTVPIAKGHGTGAVAAAPFGSASILTISWMYIKMLGGDGIRNATSMAVFNANYLMERVKNHFPVLFTGDNGRCAHEFIIDIRDIKKRTGITEEDVAKRLCDFNLHPPTMSFPIAGTMMWEPTESEPKAELDRVVEALITIRQEIDEIERGEADRLNNVLKNAPHTAEVVISDNWNRPYSREKAAYPQPYLRKNKFWPTVSRLDGVYGDRNVICACTVDEELEKQFGKY